MVVTYLFKLDVVPDQRERSLTLLNSVLDATHSKPMFHQAFLHEDHEAAKRFMLLETWQGHTLDTALRSKNRHPSRQRIDRPLEENSDGRAWRLSVEGWRVPGGVAPGS